MEPRYTHERVLWERVREDLDSDEVKAAAAQLRRGLEGEYLWVCQGLEAAVRCAPQGDWDLGDLMPPAISKFKKVLRAAKGSADSWGKSDLATEIQERLERVTAAAKAINCDLWALNAGVHFNEWANLKQGRLVAHRE